MGEMIESFETQRRTKDYKILEVWLSVTKFVNGRGEECLVTSERDITAMKNRARESEELIADLRKALAETKTLRGHIPICASCKDIKDGNGCWSNLEMYIRERTYAEFSHGICPKCAKKLYPDLDIDKIMR
jgi:hypothetical protein